MEYDEAFQNLWRDESEELKLVHAADPLVQYPVIYLDLEVTSGLAPVRYLFPPTHGCALKLSEYLSVLQRFLILQFTGTESRHVDLIGSAVRNFASKSSQADLLRFVDLLWKGRWIVGARDWVCMRLCVITGATEQGVGELQRNSARLEAEALRLIQTERQLKDTATSMDEWLYEAYCLYPDIITWFFAIALANMSLKSDELEKYQRILDEYLADIRTTIDTPLFAARGLSSKFADKYVIKPFLESESLEDAISYIRGIYRGRSIIPKIWYETARDALIHANPRKSNVADSVWNLGAGPNGILDEQSYNLLNEIDIGALFGFSMTLSSKDENWFLLRWLFNYQLLPNAK